MKAILTTLIFSVFAGVCSAEVVTSPETSGNLAHAEELDTYNIVWETPSKNHHGSMPLGNGDIGLNAWMEPNGDLCFYIGKTDSWDENSRLLKIGKVRVQLDPNPFKENPTFRQTLNLKNGEIVIESEDGGQKSAIRVWHFPQQRPND